MGSVYGSNGVCKQTIIIKSVIRRRTENDFQIKNSHNRCRRNGQKYAEMIFHIIRF
jgi:hypothetical protein